MSECQNCGAPGSSPYCSDDCREAATAPEVVTELPASSALEVGNPPITDPWASDARNYL
jgi:hypothetical protein